MFDNYTHFFAISHIHHNEKASYTKAKASRRSLAVLSLLSSIFKEVAH